MTDYQGDAASLLREIASQIDEERQTISRLTDEHQGLYRAIKEWLLADNSDSNIAREMAKTMMREIVERVETP